MVVPAKKVLLISIAILSVLAVFSFASKDGSMNPMSIPRESNEEQTMASEGNLPVRHSIDYLRQKEFAPSEIEIVREVRETSGFTSYVVSYDSGDLKQYALMNVPSDGQEKYPVVIVNHGYIAPEIYSTTDSYINTSAFYANNGFLVLKPDYRGHDESETDNAPNRRLAYVEDVMYLLTSLESLEFADTDNVFMYGHSMGGDITLKVIEATDQIKGASLWAPVAQQFPESILYFIRRNRTPERIEEIENEIFSNIDSADYEKISPLNYIHYIDTDVILHHGTNDESVPYEWSENLVKLFDEAGKEIEFYTYPGDNHDIAGNFSRALAIDVEFFKSKTTSDSEE